MGSVGRAGISYNYVELEYLLNSELETPIYLTGYLGIADNWALSLRYGSHSKQKTVESTLSYVVAETRSISLGIAWHAPLPFIPDTEWLAEFRYGYYKNEITMRSLVDTSLVLLKQENSDYLQRGFLGLRHAFAPRFEGRAGVVLYRDSSNALDTSLEGALLFRLSQSFDLAVIASETEAKEPSVLYSLALRYTW